jgi:hypothetical protein
VRRSVDVPRRYLKLAAVVLASGIAVAACGTVKMGAAAIVGNQRVSAASLNAQVDNLNTAYRKYKSKVQPSYSQSEMPQRVLGWIVQFRVGDQVAARNNIHVTQRQADKALSDAIDQITQGASGVPRDAVAVYLALPPDMLSDLGQWVAGQSALLTRLNGGKTTSILSSSVPAGVASQFDKSQCRAAKSLDVQINPQYGALDYSDFSVVSAPSGLSKAAGAPAPVASASPKPVLTAPC